jgi:hypothetical protein
LPSDNDIVPDLFVLVDGFGWGAMEFVSDDTALEVAVEA